MHIQSNCSRRQKTFTMISSCCLSKLPCFYSALFICSCVCRYFSCSFDDGVLYWVLLLLLFHVFVKHANAWRWSERIFLVFFFLCLLAEYPIWNECLDGNILWDFFMFSFSWIFCEYLCFFLGKISIHLKNFLCLNV